MNSMNPRVVKTNIKAFKELEKASDVGFGRKIEIFRKLKEWKEDSETKSTWLSQKRISLARALKEFKHLYEADEFFADLGKHDDTFEVFYRKKPASR